MQFIAQHLTRVLTLGSSNVLHKSIRLDTTDFASRLLHVEGEENHYQDAVAVSNIEVQVLHHTCHQRK